MNKTELCFTRMVRGDIDCLAVVEFTHQARLKSPADVLAAFKAGVTRWVEQTEEGKKVWDYSSGDLNIGDLMGCERDEDLDRLLKAEGIHLWEIMYQMVSSEEVSYDTVLADPEEADDE